MTGNENPDENPSLVKQIIAAQQDLARTRREVEQTNPGLPEALQYHNLRLLRRKSHQFRKLVEDTNREGGSTLPGREQS